MYQDQCGFWWPFIFNIKWVVWLIEVETWHIYYSFRSCVSIVTNRLSVNLVSELESLMLNKSLWIVIEWHSNLTQNLSEEGKGFLFLYLVQPHLLNVCRRRWLINAAVPSNCLCALTIICGCRVVAKPEQLNDFKFETNKLYLESISFLPGFLSFPANATFSKSSSSTFFITSAKKTARHNTCGNRH